jgi:hypothetical protein
MTDPKKSRLDEDYGEIDNVAPSFDKRPVTCSYCKFKFKANFRTKTPKNCPYCGRPFFVDV